MTSEVATNVATHDDPDAPSPHWAKTLPIIVGVAMSHEPDFPGLVDQFTGITPENCMKMAHIQPTEGTFRWKEADALVDFAASRKMAAHGHTLVWATDERTPEWVFRDGDKPASRPLVLERLRTHIIAVVGRYRGRVGSWDVVNEALADGHEGYLRRSGWTSLVGPDFIAQAFAWAREADPAAELYYNDYGIEAPQKREKLLRLLRDLIASGAPITAVGIQGHWEVSRVPLADLDALLESVGALGLQAAISELDIGLVPRAVWFTSDGKQRDALKDVDALAAGAPAESLDTQARAYADVFRVACRRSRCVRRVTLWGLHDGVSWLNQWPWKRTEHPLLFDRRGAPKPALKAIAAVCASLTVEESGPSIPTAAHVDASAAAMPPLGGEWEAFRGQGKRMVDEIADYYAALKSGHLLTRSSVKPGYLHAVLPKHAPEAPEAFDAVLADVHAHIIPGVTHWQSPSFFSYFPAQTSAAGLLGDMLSTAISCVGFSWAASPACTELETITTDWLAELIGLPPDFQSAGAGGGVIQGSASEATLVALLAARARALAQATRPAGAESDEALTARLVFYASDQAHSSAKKAAMVAGVMPGCFRSIASDPRTRAVSVEALVAAMAEDQAAGRVPCFVLATLGTTSSGAFDDLRGVVAAARPHAAWVHVDAAWAGSAFVCPELRAGRLDGVEGVDSLDFNPHKWLRVPFDCSVMFVRTRSWLLRALSITPEILRSPEYDRGLVSDYRDWQVPLGRRFRSLKLWFTLRMLGAEGLRAGIRRHCALAERFAAHVRSDAQFDLPVPPSLALVCFRLRHGNAANDALLARLNAEPGLALVHTKLGGDTVLRLAIGSPLTDESHIDAAWQTVQACARDILASLPEPDSGAPVQA